jgi:hypothetical protein
MAAGLISPGFRTLSPQPYGACLDLQKFWQYYLKMKSTYETVINVNREKLAEFYADPAHNILWMDDLLQCDLISGARGMIGSKYRVIPKDGKMSFIATILSKNLPYECRLLMECKSVNVMVTGRFIEIDEEKTKFLSEEIFIFNGLFSKLASLFAARAVRKAHHKHMESFKSYAENNLQ